MSKDKKPSKGRSFRDINQEYDFLDQGVDGLDAERARRERNRERRARQARNARARRENAPNQSDRPRQEFQDTTVLSQEEIQAQIRRAEQRQMDSRKRNSPSRKRALARKKKQQQRNILFIGGVVLLILIIFLVRHFLSSAANQEDVSVTEEVTEEILAPEESDLTGKLQKFNRTNKVTALYKEASDTSEELLLIEKDEYVEHYGVNENFAKVEYKGQVGYVLSIDLSDIEDDSMFKVVNGFLVANKDYYLPSDYNPGLNENLKKAFDIMADAAKKQEIEIKLASDYVSYDQQKIVYDQKVNEVGREQAAKLVEEPGHSEAQAGLLVEVMGADYEAKTSPAFDQSEEARWLKDNAHKYGFVLRYPQGKEDITGKTYQSWTYRYVGVEAANEMHEKGLSLEEYLGLHLSSTENQGTNQQNNQENTEENNVENNSVNENNSDFDQAEDNNQSQNSNEENREDNNSVNSDNTEDYSNNEDSYDENQNQEEDYDSSDNQ